MTSYAASVAPIVAEYFRRRGNFDHPIIAQVFTPGSGWKRHPLKKRLSYNEVRKLRAAGATHLCLEAGGQVADFTCYELVRSYSTGR